MILQGIINLFELLAAIFGSIYLAKYQANSFVRYFVYFLWFTIGVELIFGWLPTLIYEFDVFSKLRDTFLYTNYWIYNIYFVISFCAYILFFERTIVSKKSSKILQIGVLFYVLSSIINLATWDLFFEEFSAYTFILGTVLFLLSVFIYYLEMLKSNKVLIFYKSIPFYISIGSLVFHLTITPLLIYSKHFHLSISPEFVKVYGIIFTSANIFMYTCFTIGFIVCFKKNKSYY